MSGVRAKPKNQSGKEAERRSKRRWRDFGFKTKRRVVAGLAAPRVCPLTPDLGSNAPLCPEAAAGTAARNALARRNGGRCRKRRGARSGRTTQRPGFRPSPGDVSLLVAPRRGLAAASRALPEGGFLDLFN